MRLAPIAPPIGLVLSAGLIALAVGCGGSSEGEFREYGEVEGKPTQTRSANGSDEQRPTDPTEAANASNASADPGQDTSVASTEADAERDAAVAEPSERRAEPRAESGDLVQTVSVSKGSTGAKPQPGNPLAGSPLASEPAEPTEPREIKLLVPTATFQVVGPEGAIRITYDDLDLLKVLNMEPVPNNCVDYFPDWLKDLDGQRVRVRGFMYPTFQDTGLEAFVLARDNDICCFGRYPKRYDLIDVFMREGVTTDYIQGRPFDVVGVFHIEPEVYGGQLDRLYVIDDATVIKP